MSPLAKTLIFVGILLIVIGLIISIPGLGKYFGKLPGDIHIKHKNFSFHFPLVTCVLLSIIISLILKIFFRK